MKHQGFAIAICALAFCGRAAAAASPSIDPGRGRILFQQNCSLCHSTGLGAHPTSKQGPMLAGIMGRKAGAMPDFGYTKALAASGIIWNARTLDRFLAGPAAMIPGTNMPITVASEADRRALIAFLAMLGPAVPATPRKGLALLRRVPTPGDWQNDAPGVLHKIQVADLPPPYATESAGNSPHIVDRPPGARLRVLPGFHVALFTSDVNGPRILRTAPNGDIFVAETRMGRVRVFRAADGAEAPSENHIFAEGLEGPFGIAFYPLGSNPQWVYVANLNSVVRYPYRNGDMTARGPAETIVPQLADSTGGHTTRDIAFSLDGRRLFISVGSGSNIAEGLPVKSPEEVRAWEASHARGSAWGYEANRANILVTDPEGRRPLEIYATGIRNAVGIAIQPSTGQLWVSTNERDGLGDDLVPDYVSHIRPGGYYGWPWYYMGNHEDPRHEGERPDLAGATITPDVPLQAHSATLEMTFYPLEARGVAAFPPEYRGQIFSALHGSWNRTGRTGGKVIRVILKHGVATGVYEDFLTGFVIDDRHVWGRPVGVTVAHDGALLISDDGNDTIWRVAYGPR